MECNTSTQSDNCVLCATSERLHSWKNSGRAYIYRVWQKGEMGVTYVFQGMSERSRRLEEGDFKTFEILGSIERKICSTGVIVLENLKKCYSSGVLGAKNVYNCTRSASIPSAQQVKRYIMNNMIKCYFIFGVMLIIGFFLYCATAVATESYSFIFCSAWFYFVSGTLIWVPIFYWWRLSKLQNQIDRHRSEVTKMDKPPPYESLPLALSTSPSGGEAPPTYEEIFTDGQGLLHVRNSGFVGVPLCAVHQPAESLLTNGVQNMTDTDIIQSTSTNHTTTGSQTPSTV